MSDLATTTALPETDLSESDAAALRAELIGDRVSVKQLAVALDVCERSINNRIDRDGIPFDKIFNTRYVKLADFRQALVRNTTDAPRRRGRPRKTA
jgi:hypothetical protein